MTDSPPRKRQRFDYNDTLIICVGSQSKKFTIHKSVATSSSEYIRAALSNGWKEAQEKQIGLEHIAEEVFEFYFHWLYTKQISEPQDGPVKWLLLVRLYLLGDYLMDRLLCRHVLQAIIDKTVDSKRLADSRSVSIVWEQTTDGSPLRKVVRELWMARQIDLAIESFQKHPECPRELILDMLTEMKTRHPELVKKRISDKLTEQVKADCLKYLSELDVEQATEESNE